MTKSELIEILSRRQGHLKADDVDMAVKTLLEMMSNSLTEGDRIEIRGFGSFSLHFRPPRLGRNPKTGDSVALPGSRAKAPPQRPDHAGHDRHAAQEGAEQQGHQHQQAQAQVSGRETEVHVHVLAVECAEEQAHGNEAQGEDGFDHAHRQFLCWRGERFSARRRRRY